MESGIEIIKKSDLKIHTYEDGTHDITNDDNGEVWGPYNGFTDIEAVTEAYNKALALFGDSDTITESDFLKSIYDIVGR